MLFSLVTLSQETKKIIRAKDTDTAVNIRLDSLSKVYKREVVFYSVIQRDGRKKISITYYDKNKNLKHQVISDTPIE
jgi:hypothetical protein